MLKKLVDNAMLKEKEVHMSIGMNAAGMANGLKGTGYRQVTTPTRTPQQMQLFEQLMQGLGGGGGGLSGGLAHLGKLASGDQSGFAQSEKPAYDLFDQFMGQLGSRFAGVGDRSMSSRNSSSFQNQGTTAARQLAESLASRRMELQQSAIEDLLGLSKSLLGQNTFETGFIPKQQKGPGLGSSLLGAGLSAAGTAFGGPIGGALGGLASTGINKLFGIR
jgi:hypothetical protein